jgi:hypothetical protein
MNKLLSTSALVLAGLGVAAAHAANLSRYSSRAALLGQPPDTQPRPTLTPVAPALSTRQALLAHRRGPATEPQPVVAASFDSKKAVRGERAVEFKLAPLD